MDNYIFPNRLLYLSKQTILFVQIDNCICPNRQLYLSKQTIVFVQIDYCNCPHRLLYLSKLIIGFVQIDNCWACFPPVTFHPTPNSLVPFFMSQIYLKLRHHQLILSRDHLIADGIFAIYDTLLFFYPIASPSTRLVKI